jgi:acyl carrier protein
MHLLHHGQHAVNDRACMKAEVLGPDKDQDSYTNLSVIVATETRFRIKLRTNEIEGLKNVGDLVSIIVARAP